MPEKSEEEPVVQEDNSKVAKKGDKKPAPAAVAKVEASQPVEEVVLKQDPLAIYEKAVYFMPYKSPDFVKKLQDSFYQINMEAAKIEAGGLRALTTKKLTQEEREDRNFDFLGGFEIIDVDFRLFVIEGISSGAMKRLETILPRAEPNSETFKILKNSAVKFQERSYLDFNLDIRRIRLRDDLKSVLIKPDIYMRTKEPESICRTLNQMCEIAKCWNIKSVAQFDLFPTAQDLISTERKYSDSLTSEDILGIPTEQKKPKKGKKVTPLANNTTINDLSKSQESKANVTLSTTLSHQQIQTSALGSKHAIAIHGDPNEVISQNSVLTTGKKVKQALLHTIKPKNNKDILEIQIKGVLPAIEGDVNIYGSQKNNWYEEQMRNLRQRIREDKQNFYTYSSEYLSLSIDPYNPQDEQVIAQKLEQTRLSQKPVFRAVPPISIKERDTHPKKPDISKIEEIQNFPYFAQRKVEDRAWENTRGIPIKGQVDFNSNILPTAIFSNPEVMQSEKISPVEKEKQEREKRELELKEWKDKLKGQEYMYTKRSMPDHPQQLDKFKNMREGVAKKRGIMTKNSVIASSTIHLDRQLKDLPSSMYIEQPFHIIPEYCVRIPQNEKCISPYDFDSYQNNEILTKTYVSKPLKLDPMYK